MNIPSIESLLAELDKYKRAYESADAQILSLKEQRNRLKDERDAALKDAASANELLWSNEDDLIRIMQELQDTKSALREAKKALVMNIVGTGGRTPAAHNAIATINKVLGEE